MIRFVIRKSYEIRQQNTLINEKFYIFVVGNYQLDEKD